VHSRLFFGATGTASLRLTNEGMLEGSSRPQRDRVRELPAVPVTNPAAIQLPIEVSLDES
jgi:hypothetical protein